MRVLTREQARELDSFSINKLGVSSKNLMTNAGDLVAKTAKNMICNIRNPKILILCGKGNNGGDGFAAAITLLSYGYSIKIFSISSQKGIKGDTLYFYNKCCDLNIPILFGPDLPDIENIDLIIDALLGTGFQGTLKPYLIPLIERINNIKTKALSIDIPSGLDSNSGLAKPVAVQADSTATMGSPKLGMVLRQGKYFSGETISENIGFPEIDNFTFSGMNWEIFDERLVSKMFEKVKPDTHKYERGKVLVIAGSRGMTGAAILATMGALRSGSGLTITTTPKSLNTIFESNIIEGMTMILQDNDSGYLILDNLDEILEKSTWADSVILGPGLGRNKSTQALIKKLVLNIKSPMVLDADGLYPFAKNLTDLNNRKSPLIITPHIGELASLTDIDKEDIKNDFTNIMTDIMNNFHHVALVKQAPVCVFNRKRVTINSSGNPGLATSGTGDVLAGIIGSFLSNGIDTKLAAHLGAFIHGKTSDQLVEKFGYRGQIATDLLPIIPRVIAYYEHL